MDKFDQDIIAILTKSGRRSVSEIAREVNLSRTAVTARIKRLEEEGVILGYHATVARPESQVTAYMALHFDTSNADYSCEKYSAIIEKIPEVQWMDIISGETDMMLFVEAKSMQRLNQIRDDLQKLPYLRHLITHTVLNTFFNRRF
ncbi:Lrp/AsnC family transcriptional regulator [Thaumasiovibrio subtropicus]|uniref:Lrp/AsnC family transcriptional regulator n=1 Tax=Thaumasiovibrio subtropicus TaxID=1891207 RepID=UPI000B360ED1|nr:Lrp/AsnC family transcriptional regulator [Thaumasiovibrio subtropicus]